MAVFLNKTKITFLKDEKLPIETILRYFGTEKQFDNQHQVMKWESGLESKLDDAPPYQREDKADLIWRQGIINSLLIDIPFPDLYWRVISGMWEIVDGGHRIRTTNMFVLDMFQLPKKYRPVIDGKVYKCDGLYFSQCPQVVQDKILYSNWRVQKFEADDKTTARMFHIINNGNEMTPQEDRLLIKHLRNVYNKEAKCLEKEKAK